MTVSRETNGPFGDRLEIAEAYARLLATVGVERGLIGPREAERVWDRHVLNSVGVVGVLAAEVEMADVGSGAGLPGIPVAIARPDLRVVLVEPLLRRATFLLEAVETLQLTNVTVVRARAEELHGQRRFPVVTARAVAPLERLAAWCLPLVEAGGELVAMKGERAAEELAAAAPVLSGWGATAWEVDRRELGAGHPPVHLIRIRMGSPGGPQPAAAAARRRTPRPTAGRPRRSTP